MENIGGARAGEVFPVQAKFKALDKSDLLFGYDAFLFRQGYSGTCSIIYAGKIISRHEGLIAKFRARIKKTAEKFLGPGEASGFPLSTSLGIKDVLSKRTEDAFKHTGLAHVLVVSGYQVTLIFGIVIAFCEWILKRFAFLIVRIPIPFLAVPLGLALTYIFVLLVEPDGPVLRAWIAVLIVSAKRLLDTGSGAGHALLVTLFIISVVTPGSYLDPGVELSFAALAGLMLGETKGRSALGKLLYASFAASTFTSAVCALRFQTFSVISPLINPVMAPLLSIIGCNVVLLGVLFNWLGIDPGGLLLKGSSIILLYLRDATLYMASLEWSYLSGVASSLVAAGISLLLLFLLIVMPNKRVEPLPCQ